MLFTLSLRRPEALDAPAIDQTTSTLHVGPDFPISVTCEGRVLSRHCDDVWDLTPYAQKITRLRFGTIKGFGGEPIDRRNIDLFKRVMMWALYALGRCAATTTVRLLFHSFCAVTKLCIDNRIAVCDLQRHPAIYRELATRIKPSQWHVAEQLLRRLFRDRDLLGFVVLDYDQITEVGRRVPRRESAQTPYIPERIYHYVIERCSQVVDEYLANEAAFGTLYRTCVDAVLRARDDFGPDVDIARLRRETRGTRMHAIGVLEHYCGKPFRQLAADAGVVDLIIELVGPKAHALGSRSLSRYLSTVSLAARILIAALSAMREREHASLRVNCCESREDPLLGTTFLLKGRTTKTQSDSTAYWVTSALCARAVAAADSIAWLRADGAQANPLVEVVAVQRDAAMLFERNTDPWLGAAFYNMAAGVNPQANKTAGLGNVLKAADRLFDERQLTINDEDLSQAVRLTPRLDLERFRVGAVWPLAWHQLRRTLVCLALGSGVSLPSLAWQLKHAGPAMTRHYGDNYFGIPMDRGLRKEFAQAQVEILLVKGMEFAGDTYIPLTGGRKETVIRLITHSDAKAMEKLAREGRLAFKPTALGACTNPEPCPFGGWDHIAECLRCGKALASTGNKSRLNRMVQILDADLAECTTNDGLLRDSLSAQYAAAQEALRVIG